MKKIENLPVIAISTFGHCGIDWLHSLIDSHKQVLIIPPLSFFRKISILKKKRINLNNIEDVKKITNIFLEKSDNKIGIKRNNILNHINNKSLFIKKINEFLLSKKKINIEKRLFLAIHYAYSKVKKINLNKIKVIVAHEHAPWNCYEYDKYFNSKFIFMVRDPRATIAGSLRGFERHNNVPLSFPIDINLSFMFAASEFCKKMTKKKVLILRNEDMVQNLKKQMKKVSKWINIKFNKSLLKQTFAGKAWFGESSYLGKGDLKKKRPKNYYKPKNIESRWRSFLDENTIFIIETIYEKLMLQNKYKFDNKINTFKRISGHLVILFKFNEFKNLLSFLNPNFIKNILRRSIIIFYPSLSRKIFNVAL